MPIRLTKYQKAVALFQKYYHWLAWESKAQAELVIWLEERKYIFTAIPNSTHTESFKQKTMNTILWLRPGISDMLIVLKNWSLLFLEMKKPKVQYRKKSGGLWKVRTENGLQKNQIEWKNILNSIKNVNCEVAYGFIQATKIVEYYEKK